MMRGGSTLRGGLLVLALMAGPALPARAEIVDRIVATVDRQVITQSEVEESWRIERLLNQDALEPLSAEQAKQVTERLVTQALLELEMRTSRFPRAPRSEIDQRILDVQERYGGPDKFQETLDRYGLEAEAVRRRFEQIANIERFIDLRLRPMVSVDDAAIESYYQEQLLPRLKAQHGQDVPSLLQVRDQIEEVLRQRRITEELASWLKDLRTQSDVRFR